MSGALTKWNENSEWAFLLATRILAYLFSQE